MSSPTDEEAAFGVPTGTIVAGRYKILRPLTEGGMATVFTAEELGEDGQPTGVERAIKIMAPRLLRDAKSLERFQQESMIGTTLRHPHIVEVLGAGIDPALESPWIAMELLTGGTLSAVLRERGALPIEEVRELFLQFGAAMAAAHQAGVVHRDLKPENLFLESTPSVSTSGVTLPYTVKVLDFGIAKVRKDVTMKNSQLIGSPLWMAPEQLSAGTAIGPFTDVWPFGLLAFHALTARPYWLAANAPSLNLPKLLAEIMAAEIVAPSVRARALGLDVEISPALDAWFLRCVARDHQKRFASVGEAADKLDRALAPGARESLAPVEDAAEPEPTPVAAVVDEPPPMTVVQQPAAPSRAPFAMAALALGLLGAAVAAWFFSH